MLRKAQNSKAAFLMALLFLFASIAIVQQLNVEHAFTSFVHPGMLHTQADPWTA